MTTRTWLLVLMALGMPVAAQQLADSSFRFINAKPAFAAGKGPRACIDLAHHNFQSPGQNPGSYDPFAQLLRGDGYRVRETSHVFTSDLLADCELLVIVLPVGRENQRDWAFPHSSAFTRAELEAVYPWIQRGGGLLLITDHAPGPGAIADLASMLGVVLLDGAGGRAAVGAWHFEWPRCDRAHRSCRHVHRRSLPSLARMVAIVGVRQGGRGVGRTWCQPSRCATK
jgi:hypothetical protein